MADTESARFIELLLAAKQREQELLIKRDEFIRYGLCGHTWTSVCDLNAFTARTLSARSEFYAGIDAVARLHGLKEREQGADGACPDFITAVMSIIGSCVDYKVKYNDAAPE